MDIPNSSARDDSEGNPTDGSNDTRPSDESTPFQEPEADDAGEHTANPAEISHSTTDEIFNELVAGLSDVDSGSVPNDTDSGRNVPVGDNDAHSTSEASSSGWAFPVAPWVHGSGPRDSAVTLDESEQQQENAEFVPPDPGNVLSKDPVRNLAWAAVLLGPITIIFGSIFWPNGGTLVAQISGLAFLAGIAALLWRMPKSRNPLDDDPGAII